MSFQEIYHVRRCRDCSPIVSAEQFVAADIPEDGGSINGPSLVRLPEWVPAGERAHAEARYYLYFSHHNGTYIRMAWSVDLRGPYWLYNADGTASNHRGRGVLALRELDGRRALAFENGVEVYGHIASPDVHLDNASKRFVLYFHGITNTSTPPPHPATGPQKTLVATSAYGLDFCGVAHGSGGGFGVRPALLGNAYFRVFGYGEFLYAFSNGGELWRCRRDSAWEQGDPPTADAWEPGPNPILDRLRIDGRPADADPRHFSVRFIGTDLIEVYYTVRGDVDESIERTELDISPPDWCEWRAEAGERLLSPDEPWEGGDRPSAPSRPGGETGVRQLRDPAVFQDAGGKLFLLYSGGGEEAIGIAALQPVDREVRL